MRITEAALAKVGVELEDAARPILRCAECGQGWSPNFQSGGRLRRRYWVCPNGCNDPDRADPEVSQLAARIPADLHRRIKVYAAKTGTAMNALVSAALTSFLKGREAHPGRT